MDVILFILGVLGFGAIVIAAYVFTVAARNYVSAENHHLRQAKHTPPTPRQLVTRSPVDRRSGKTVEFPLTVNGEVIPEDRRHQPDRRKAA
jgi:hypothetical protein